MSAGNKTIPLIKQKSVTFLMQLKITVYANFDQLSRRTSYVPTFLIYSSSKKRNKPVAPLFK